MPGPGSGRYTNYTPLSVNSATAYGRRLGLFNLKAASSRGDFQKDLVANAVKILEKGAGDSQMFPTGVSMAYSGAPKLADAQVDRPGDPGNPYIPDLSSPGADDGKVNVNPLEKDGQGKIAVADLKSTYVLPTSPVGQSSDSLGTQSPSLTSPLIGASPINANLVLGKSKGSQGG